MHGGTSVTAVTSGTPTRQLQKYGGLYHLAKPRFSANSAPILAKFMFLYVYAYAKYALNKLNLLLSKK